MSQLTNAELRQAINDTYEQALNESVMSLVLRDHLNALLRIEKARAETMVVHGWDEAKANTEAWAKEGLDYFYSLNKRVQTW